MRTEKSILLPALILIASFLFVNPGAAADMGGWEEDGVYNALYLPTELDRLKCRVTRVIEVEPLPGMSPGIALLVDDGDGEKITVHIGPKWFLGDSVAIRRGDKLKIRGSWAEIDGTDVFMASKIKKGDYYQLKVRLTKNGKPFWVMSPDELAKERASQ